MHHVAVDVGRGNHDDRYLTVFAEVLDPVETVEARQSDIKEDQVGLGRHDFASDVLPVIDCDHGVLPLGQLPRDGLDDLRVVLHDKDFCHNITLLLI